MNIDPQEIFAEIGTRLGPAHQKDMQDDIREKMAILVRLDLQYRLLYGDSYLQVVMDDLAKGVSGDDH